MRARLAQSDPFYALSVPLVLETEGRRNQLADLANARASVSLVSPSRPRALLLDPDLLVFRRLDARELAPILRQVMLHPGTRVCMQSVGATEKEAAQRLVRAVLEHAPDL